ncbi:TPA: hypothetical protein U5E24_001562 [Yersinia enterocolitica]|nr:hypothetical protein [Yersinia enterocolitica]
MALTLLSANNASTVLAAGISSTATTLTVNTGTGSLFPSPVSGTSFFKLTLIDAATGTLTEIVHVTARTGDTMTIVRAQEGTVSRLWSANDIAANMMTAGTLTLLAQKDFSLQTSNNLSEIAAAGPASVAASLANLGLSDVAHLAQLTGVIGTSRNAKMSVTVASATATFTADELIVQTALGGRQYKLSSFSKTINLATTGAGGMDTGTVPAAGFVALYAIYNPTTQVSALLAPEVYGGANMPAGYTASALVSVWRITSSTFVIGYQVDRRIVMTNVTAVSGSTQQASLTAISLNLIAPINAKTVSGTKGVVSTSAGTNILNHVASTSSGLFQILMSGGTIAANIGITGSFADLPVIIPQTVYYTATVGTGTISMNVDINGYTF